MAMTKIKGLQMWCKKMAEGYPLVDIANFTTAWRDGLAFCAIIHRFRPDLIDFHSLSPDDVFENCKLAFEIAERELNIPAFLEAEDMVRLKVPDKLSIITYVSQYYNYLHALPQLGGPGVKGKVSTKTISGTKRPSDSETSQAPITKKATTESKENLAPANEKPTAGGDKCAICQNHVYLVERHMDSGKLYHRSCFRRSEMSPANKVLTRSPFLSPSLSFDTHSSTALDVDSKHSRVDKSSKDVNNHKQDVQPTKTTSDSSFFPKKVESVGVKHTFNEPSKEDPKKAKMEPRTLFHNDKSKMISATKDNPTAENMFNKNSDSGKYLSKSNKETLNGEKRPQDVLLSEKKVELSKSAQLKFQHKDSAISDTPRCTVTVPTTTTGSINIIKKDHPETKSATVISKTLNTPLPSQSGSEVQSKYKHTGNEGTQKSSFESKSDSSLSKANPLPSVQNLQKTFSGKSDLDLRESSKSSHPVARPRSGTLKSIVEDSTATPKNPGYTTADATPKAAPRRSMLEVSSSVTTVTPKQQGVFTPNEKYLGTDGTKMGTPGFPYAELPPPIPKSAPPPLPTSVPSGGTTFVAGDFKRPQADKLFQETKASLHPTKITEDPKSTPVNTNHTPYQRNTNLNKTTTQEHIQIHQPGISNNSSDDKVLSGLLSSLAGVRGKASTPGPTNHASQSPAKIASPSFDNKNKTQSESIAISSSKTPVNKINITTLTPAKLPQKSASQTDTSSSSSAVKDSTKNLINNDGTNNAKSRTEKSVVLQGHNDSALPGKTLSSIQTPNKTQEPVGTPRFTHQAAGTPGITASNNITRAELKLNKPANINNEPKPGLSYIVDTHNKEQTTATSKVQPQKNNQISHLQFSEENTVILKNAEKKSQITDTKYDSKQTSSTAESKSVPYSKNKVLSSSKEDLLDINSVKLKVVMPEQKKVQEPKTAVYDVKLKKVDVIKGDTRWDNTPGKPLKSVNASEGNKNTGIYAFSGDQIEGIQKELAEKPSGSFTKDLSLGNSQKSGISNELPVWKKDVEENNNKFRSQSQTEINQLKDPKGVNDKKMAIHVEKKVDVDSKNKAAEVQNTSDGLLSLHKRPGDIKSGGKDLVTNVESKRNSIKLSPNIENKGNGSKLDWQLEAEKRMAALAGFDLEIVEKLKEPNKPPIVSSGIIGNPPNKMYGKSEGNFSTNSDKTYISDRKFNGDTLMSGDSNAQGKSTVIEKTSTTKSKESGLEFLLNKTKLKSVEVDISILPEKEIESHATNDDRSKGEDFRSILHQLKRVPAIESGKLDNVKPSTGIDLHRNAAALDTHPPSVAKPSQTSTVNVNNNNRPATTDQNKVSGAETINKLSSNECTPLKSTGFQVSTDSTGIEKRNQISELPKEKLALGKFTPEKNDNGRIKITTLGKSIKVTAASPPTSPVQKKKIHVTRKFDFEQSSDFEHSLTNSTAKLTIQDKHTTPPAPRSQHVGPSPNHISAIELQNQLLNIDVRLTELELKGREIEETIRKVDSLEDDEDQLMIQWFSVINEKNDLVRMEADLIYVSREQDLENEQDKIEHQLRYLMSKPDECKSPEEKEEEDYLLKHKLTLVEQRNKIVDSMDEDRIRYEDEDRGIEVTLKNKGLWKDSTGTLKALKGKKVAKSVFYT